MSTKLSTIEVQEIVTQDELQRILKLTQQGHGVGMTTKFWAQLEDLLKQRAAALKLADTWIEQQTLYPLENENCTHPKTAGEVEIAQVFVKACAKELRAILGEKP